MSESDAFYELLDRFKAENQATLGAGKSRAEETAPKLRLEKQGKYTIIEGLLALARHTRRSEEYVVGIFRQMTGAVVESMAGNRLTIRGELPLRLMRRFQNQYINKFVCCKVCHSPQTSCRGEEVVCNGCGAVQPLK